MSDRLTEFGPDVVIVVLSFAEQRYLDRYLDTNDVTVPVVTDIDRQTYRRYGLDRGSLARIWGPRTLRRYAQLYRSEGFDNLRRATEDTRQLGGDFVIDPAGNLSYGFWSAGPYDRPSVDELLAAVRAR